MGSAKYIGLKDTVSFEDEYGSEHVMTREFNGTQYYIHVSIIKNIGGFVAIYSENYSQSCSIFQLPPDDKMFNMMVYSTITQGKRENILFN